MSEESIWSALRAGGLSDAGTAAVMGNFYCESLLKSDNVEDRCSLSDSDYTYNVDSGIKSRQSFCSDAYGYGLAQWTYSTRKAGLYDLANSKCVSISDEQTQCEFCINELKREYSSLYSYLCSTADVYNAASRVCTEYERPAVNNISARANKAQEYYSKYSGTNAGVETVTDACNEIDETAEKAEVTVRTVRKGDTGTDVAMLQTGLNKLGYSCGTADGIFGNKTLSALNQMKNECNIPVNGIADGDTWQFLFQ